jgi:hypothetical protein
MIPLALFALGAFLLALALGWRLAQLAVQRRARDLEQVTASMIELRASLVQAREGLERLQEAIEITYYRKPDEVLRDELIAASLNLPKPMSP